MRQAQQNKDEGESIALTYQEIIERFGDSHRYQYCVSTIILLCWLYAGIALNGTIFLFMNPGFDCSAFHLKGEQCERYVCSNYFGEERLVFENQKTMESLVTEYGPYHCEQNYDVSLMRALINLGSAIGCFFLIFTSDNGSKRFSFLLSIFFLFLGSFILFLSRTMVTACIGVFIIGLGLYSVMKLGMAIINEICSKDLSANFIGLTLSGYTVGGIIIPVVYNFTKNWRLSVLYAYLFPSIIIFILAYFYVKQTPKSLAKYQEIDQVMRVLNWISKFNDKGQNNFQQSQIRALKQQQLHFNEIKSVVTPLDLCRYPSLRYTTIILFTAVPFTQVVYFGHGIAIQSFGFNPLLNQVLLSIAELISVLPIILFASKLERKKVCVISAFISIALSLASVFIYIPQNCEGCSEMIMQLIMVMMVRSLIVFHIAFFQNVITQFYPLSINSIGIGMSGVLGSLGSGLTQILIMDSSELGVNPFVMISCAFAVLFGLYCLSPETLGMKKRSQIEQVEEKKDREEIE